MLAVTDTHYLKLLGIMNNYAILWEDGTITYWCKIENKIKTKKYE
jgi:hypothetical protein